jgi:putative membrane protein insertion efficiency factor
MKKDNFLVKLSIQLIRKIHQEKISDRLNKRGIHCRFYPSCSNYGIMALNKYGFLKGWLKTINRIRRCRPDNYDTKVDYP